MKAVKRKDSLMNGYDCQEMSSELSMGKVPGFTPYLIYGYVQSHHLLFSDLLNEMH